MKDKWTDKKFASEWDSNAAIKNPTRSLLLDLLVTIIADSYMEGKKILDLGFGSGQIESMLFAKIPNAQIIGVDASQTMINLAIAKLGKYPGLNPILHDLTKIDDLVIPQGEYQFVITSFVLHELPQEKKRKVFEFIYQTLMPGGLYLLVDRFKIDAQSLKIAYLGQRSWQKRKSNWQQDLTLDQYVQQMAEKQDFPDTLEDQLKWLRETGFAADCLQFELDRGLIAAVKK